MTDRPEATPRRPRRWLAAVIAASAAPGAVPPMPFQRGARRRPASLATPTRPTAQAAR
ncbi:MAG TPA: hypothetical protein PKC84_08060 [Paracoccaceae bacterium]|nr:hypothetical protein [Paracoccaceae bacterium]